MNNDREVDTLPTGTASCVAGNGIKVWRPFACSLDELETCFVIQTESDTVYQLPKLEELEPFVPSEPIELDTEALARDLESSVRAIVDERLREFGLIDADRVLDPR